jgi:hypothetical protein
MGATLTAGQNVYVNGGFGPVEGTVVKIVPPCIWVETGFRQLRFNTDGKECDPNGKAYMYDFDVTFGPGPWVMTMNTLAVGQKIRISCGQFSCWSTVISVTPEGMEVQNDDGGGRLRFDSEGTGYYMEETFDCPGPWYIDPRGDLQ